MRMTGWMHVKHGPPLQAQFYGEDSPEKTFWDYFIMPKINFCVIWNFKIANEFHYYVCLFGGLLYLLWNQVNRVTLGLPVSWLISMGQQMLLLQGQLWTPRNNHAYLLLPLFIVVIITKTRLFFFMRCSIHQQWSCLLFICLYFIFSIFVIKWENKVKKKNPTLLVWGTSWIQLKVD